MDYKEKLEEARKLYLTSNADQRYVLESLFPELVESEDERIRKELIEFIKKRDRSGCDYDYDKWIAWLEKQGNNNIKWNKNTKGNKPQVNHSVLMQTMYGIVEGEWKGENWYQYRWSGIIKDSEVIAWIELSNIEKQGETYTKKDVDDAYLKGICDTKQELEKQGEPKFEVGCWIIRSAEGFKHNTYLVTEVKDYYVCEDLKGRRVTFTFNDVHKNFKLWTIFNAKDGDVLHSPAHNLIWIHKDIQHYHACVNMNYVKENFITKGFIVIPTDVCPATKGLRDILFAKMKEAGYEWDAEKKEVNKLINWRVDRFYEELNNPYND